jgi:uncharacterized coiled-coil protein SlyX
MNDKELKERIEEIKNSNSNIPICVVEDAEEFIIKDKKTNKDKEVYLLHVVFNKKFLNEKKTIVLKKSYFSKGNKLNGKTLTGKLYLLFKIKKYSNTDDERNKKLFLVLKNIGVVTKDNEIDITKFKGLVFQVGKNASVETIKKNPNYTVRYDYLFNCEYSPSLSFYHTKKMFNGYKGWHKDYEEFRKIDKKNVKELKGVVTKAQEQKVNKVIDGFDRVIKDGYNGENTETDCKNLIRDFLIVSSRSELSVKELSITNLSSLFCNLIKQVDEQNRRIDELENKVDEQDRRIDEQDRKIRKQNRRIDELEKKLNRLENR